MKKNNIDLISKWGLCMGCGVCSNACKAGAITMELQWDSYKPFVDTARCLADKGCNRCLQCCPGKGADFSKNAERFHAPLSDDDGLGQYTALYTGYSSNDSIRLHSASGGMVTALLLYLLEKRIIAGAVVTAPSPDLPYQTRSFLARTAQDILTARSSRYCPASLHDIYKPIISSEGLFVIVGLPCHLQGFRALADRDAAFASKIYGYFGLYCSSTRTSLMPEYLCYKYGLNKGQIDTFSFRDGGNPGYLKAADKKGNVFCSVHYHDYYRKLRSFFTLRRCMLCFDQTAEFADLAFGDIHLSPYLQDTQGVNSLIVRNPQFDILLQDAARAGILVLNPVSKDDLYASQQRMIYMKKQRIHAVFFLRKLFLKKTPDYGDRFHGTARLKDIISVLGGLMQTWIGRRRHFWFMISGLEKQIVLVKRIFGIS